ncbi:hypothetical protein KIN20_032593 [Parelaphostrongylus tenuis]|uniref:RGS domain-containing protein n=1 Tax=Parelaphostrongylus tenuis TaxID=148309 RepID=A0AAD5R7A5_PARTN|nr:hypothetical protein KIN20_032593 [Parelaphostrongylus tenuis]
MKHIGWSFDHRHDYIELVKPPPNERTPRRSVDAPELPSTPPPLPSSSPLFALPPLSNFRANALTRQKRSVNLRAFQRHLDPFFEDGESFYDISGSWERFDMTSQQHDIDAICTKNVNVRPRRCRFERIGLRDSRRRTAAQMEKRKLKKLNGLGNEDENTKIYWCSRVSTRSCRRNSSRMVTTTMSDIVEDNCNLIIPYTESPYRMSTESKHMTGSLRATEDTSNKSGRLENPDVTRAAKLDELNQCDRRRATDSTLTTFEHCCSSNKSSNTNNNRINKQCVCVTTTPNASAFISSKRSAEVVGVGSGNRQHQQQHCRTTTLPQASQYVFRPQLSLPLRLSNVANGTVDEELAGAVGCGGSTRFCSQKTRNKSRVCDEQRTLSTSLTASDGGGDQLASTADATAIVRTSGGDYVPDFGTLTDGLILPETNASRDVKIFKRVLRDPKLRQPFQAFLEQQFCAENLNFYVAVERFRDMQFNNENKASERANFARHIYERHFATNSTEPVNVDNSTSKRIRETMEAGKYPRNTFDLAQYQIFHLLKYDCWPRFLRAGGVQPEFSDEELAEEDERQHRLDIGEDLPESHSTRSANEGDRQPSTSTSTLCAITDRKKMSTSLPHRHPPPSRTEPKYCRLMTGDTCSTEVVKLTDPTISVRQWTQNMAVMLGMDKNATEAVDAETCNTIDPARQAIDALQSRSVRIVPVVTFAVEILPPNYSFKSPSSTPTKIILVRARHSLSAGGVLRPLLSKYSIDYSTITVLFSGTLEVIRNSVSIGNIGTRSLTVMTQSQYNERVHGGKKDLPIPRDPIITSSNLAAEHNLQFHQHGDVSYCELPSEADRLKHAQKEHSLSLMKFVRKASAAVSNKEETTRFGSQRIPSRRKSVGQSSSAGVYCGEEVSMEAPKEPIRKRLSLFKNRSKDLQQDRLSASGDRSFYESSRSQAQESTLSTPQRHPVPVVPPLPRTTAISSSPMPSEPRTPVSPRTSNGNAPRTPAIFSSKVCSEGEEVVSSERGWQAAAYV